MSSNSKIAWTGDTWNPIVGCSIVSPGCTNCYAMQMAARIEVMQPALHYAGTTKKVKDKAVWTGKLAMAPDHILTTPLRWKKPRKIFVNSMSDLFHESVPDYWIDKVFAVMALCPQHTFQVLTKRSKRMREYFEFYHASKDDNRADLVKRQAETFEKVLGRAPIKNLKWDKWPLPNAWLGVSCEDQTRADERIPDLLATPAAVRFVSAEPLLGPIDFTMIPCGGTFAGHAFCEDALRGPPDMQEGERLDWIIIGGESGANRRAMQIEWATDIINQCKTSGTACFVKQDAGPRPGIQGRFTDEQFATKQFPEVRT